MALSFAIEAEGQEEVGLLAAGTDGTDGPTNAAGAFSDGQTEKRATRGIIDKETFLQDNNSNEFHRKTGSLYFTGPTGTNVMDITVLIVR
jgi:glycerate-2-kinase